MKDFKPVMEPGGRQPILDKLGYVPADVRIKRLLQSGVRYAAASAEVYDGVDDGSGEFVIPPWRQKDFDLADASQFLRSAVKRKDELLRLAALAKVSVDAEEEQTIPGQAQPAQEGAGASAPAGGRGAEPRVE